MTSWGMAGSYTTADWTTRYNAGKEGGAMTETMWKCDQMRAGRLYSRSVFDTREEAERFARKMQQMEPDQMMRVEPVEARQFWN